MAYHQTGVAAKVGGAAKAKVAGDVEGEEITFDNHGHYLCFTHVVVDD